MFVCADAHTHTRHYTGKAELVPEFTSRAFVKQHEVLIYFRTKSLFLVDELQEDTRLHLDSKIAQDMA